MEWICTTEGKSFERMTDARNSGGIPVETGSPRQTVRGFGACFNELGRIALQRLPEDRRKSVMRELFAPDAANLRFCRVPVGANDFAESWYSLNETPGDYAMACFSLERDRGCILPFIREAQEYAPDLELFASPWSPPTWMKTPAVYNFGRLKDDPRTMEAYALYLELFLRGFAGEGAPVKRLCVQNEVFADQKFPSCLWSGAQMRDFIRDYLGPRLESGGLDTDLWLGTVNGPFIDYEMGNWHGQSLRDFILPVMLDAGAARHVKGFALQWGAKHILPHLSAQYPEVEIIQSECECGDGSNAFASVFYVFDLLWQYFRAGATAFTYWNFALETDCVSTWGWKQNSLVTVDPAGGEARYNPEFYLMKHLSAYVRPNACALDVSGRWAAYSMAFANPDGGRVYVLANPTDTEQRVEIHRRSYLLAPRSLHTLYYAKDEM